jgi:hypothetical protein
LFQASALLPMLALALRLGGLRRTQAVLWRLAPFFRPHRVIEGDPPDPRARVIARMVRAAAAHGPYRANCLKQSLALWWLLRVNGIESDVCVGVRRALNGIEAHAWVEYQDRPLNDREDVDLRFTPFRLAIIPAWRTLSS